LLNGVRNNIGGTKKKKKKAQRREREKKKKRERDDISMVVTLFPKNMKHDRITSE